MYFSQSDFSKTDFKNSDFEAARRINCHYVIAMMIKLIE